jgi:2-methylcitrate dehydratase PrpD
LKKQDVKTFMDGQLSGPFSVALALSKRESGYRAFMEGISDKEILNLTNKIRMVEDNGLGFSERTAIVEITNKSGKVYSQKVELPKGEPETPFSNEEIEEKFRNMASTCIRERKINQAIGILKDLENMGEYARLTECLIP